MPDIIAEPRREPAGDIVRAQIGAAERQRTLITEYIHRNRRPDTDKIVGPVTRREIATPSAVPPPSDLMQRLTELADMIGQVEVALHDSEASAPDVHFATERIHDVAFSLRQRDVEPALCDTLEAAIREVGDAIVRNDVAAARAAGAAAQLRDLGRYVGDMIDRFTDRDVAHDPEPQLALEPVGLDIAGPGMAPASAFAEQPLPSAQATAPFAAPARLPSSAPLSTLPFPSPMDRSDDSPSATGPQPDTASASSSDNAAAVAPASTDSIAVEPQRQLLPGDLYSPAAEREPTAGGDSSANLFALSDEELIALFS
jgi:hypothetical protein